MRGLSREAARERGYSKFWKRSTPHFWSLIPFYLAPLLANWSLCCARQFCSTLCSLDHAIQWGCCQYLPEGVQSVAAGGGAQRGLVPSTQAAGCWGRITPVVAYPSKQPLFHKRPTTAMPRLSSVVKNGRPSHESAPADSAQSDAVTSGGGCHGWPQIIFSI